MIATRFPKVEDIEQTVDWGKQITPSAFEMNLTSPMPGAEDPFPPETRCSRCGKLIAGLYDHWCDNGR